MLVTQSDRIFTYKGDRTLLCARQPEGNSEALLRLRSMVRKQQSADRTSHRKCDRSQKSLRLIA
jgi:hypothetical protein